MADPNPRVPPRVLLRPLAFELYAVALHGRPPLGEDRDHVDGRAGAEGGEQRFHRANAERDVLAVHDDLIPGLVVAHVPLAAEVVDGHGGYGHTQTLHHQRAKRGSSFRPAKWETWTTRPHTARARPRAPPAPQAGLWRGGVSAEVRTVRLRRQGWRRLAAGGRDVRPRGRGGAISRPRRKPLGTGRGGRPR